MKEVKIMFIDYALMILGGLVLLAYAVANILVVANYSIRFMWKEFWVEQKWFGKVCANVFYLPAWVISFVLVAIVIVLNVIIVPLYKLFKLLANWISPLFNQALKLNI
jgi:hypothetical protein